MEGLRRLLNTIGQDARARERDDRNPFDPSYSLPRHLDSAPHRGMAMDEVAGVSQWALEGINGFLGQSREGFIGYPELSLLWRRLQNTARPSKLSRPKRRASGLSSRPKATPTRAKSSPQSRRNSNALRFNLVSIKSVGMMASFGRAHIYPDIGTDLNNREELC